MKPHLFFIDRPVLSCVISALTIILGIIGILNLPLEQFPEIAPATIRVSFSYTGASAEAIQKTAVIPIEEAINGVENINYMTSSSNNNGTAVITVYFRKGTNPDMAAVNVQNRISSIQGNLPQEVIKTGVTVRKSQNGAAKIISLHSPDGSYDQKFLYNYFKINIEPRLARIKGVGDITVFGSEYSLRIWLKPDKMAQYKLIPSDITSALEEQNLEAPIGSFGADAETAFQYVVKYRGRYDNEEDFGNIVIKSAHNGEILRLKDVADIELGSASYAVKNELAGHPGTNCMIAQAPGSNVNEVVKEIDKVVKEAAANMPSGMQLTDLVSITSFMDASIRNVIKTLIETIILVIAVIFIFLRNARPTVVPLAAIAVSLVGTFAFLYFAGLSLNMLTLFALVLVIGTVVDDAIVMTEAVQAKLDGGYKSPYTAAADALKELILPLAATSLVFMAAFIPVCFIGGTAGTFYTQFGATMAAAVCISTVNALTLSPALCRFTVSPNTKNRFSCGAKDLHSAPCGGIKSLIARFGKLPEGIFRAVSKKYGRCVVFFLKRPALAFLLPALALCGFLLLLNSMKTGLVPDEDTGTVVVDIQTAPGTSLARTENIMRAIEERIANVPQILIYSKSVGMGMLAGQGASNGTFIIRLKHWNERKGKNNESKAVTADIYKRLSGITEAKIMVFSQPIIPGYGVTNGFEVHIQDISGGSVNRLQKNTEAFIAALNRLPEISRAQTNFNAAYPQYLAEVDAALCKRAGISPQELLNTLACYIGGIYSSDMNKFSKLYRVMIQAPPQYRLDKESLDNIFVKTSDGKMSPVSVYLTLKRVYGSETLSRFNMFPSIAVNGAAAEGYSSGQVIEAIRRTAAQTLPAGYGYEFGSMTREEAETGNSSVWVFTLSVIFIYMILCALYESPFIPLAVILSIPFGLAGSFIFAKTAGLENNIYMQTGAVMLIGLLSKTAILITEYASEKRKAGASIAFAAVSAAKARLRPIMMTSLTMVFGLAPMAFASGVGSNGSRSLGIGTTGGMIMGTTALLFITPALFAALQSAHEKIIPGKNRN